LGSCVNPFLIAGYGELIQQGNEIEKQVGIKALWRETN